MRYTTLRFLSPDRESHSGGIVQNPSEKAGDFSQSEAFRHFLFLAQMAISFHKYCSRIYGSQSKKGLQTKFRFGLLRTFLRRKSRVPDGQVELDFSHDPEWILQEMTDR